MLKQLFEEIADFIMVAFDWSRKPKRGQQVLLLRYWILELNPPEI